MGSAETPFSMSLMLSSRSGSTGPPAGTGQLGSPLSPPHGPLLHGGPTSLGDAWPPHPAPKGPQCWNALGTVRPAVFPCRVSHCPSLCSHTAEIVPLTGVRGTEASRESPGPTQLWPLASPLPGAASRLPAGILGSRLPSTRTADRDRLPVITLPDLAATCRRVTLT